MSYFYTNREDVDSQYQVQRRSQLARLLPRNLIRQLGQRLPSSRDRVRISADHERYAGMADLGGKVGGGGC